MLLALIHQGWRWWSCRSSSDVLKVLFPEDERCVPWYKIYNKTHTSPASAIPWAVLFEQQLCSEMPLQGFVGSVMLKLQSNSVCNGLVLGEQPALLNVFIESYSCRFCFSTGQAGGITAESMYLTPPTPKFTKNTFLLKFLSAFFDSVSPEWICLRWASKSTDFLLPLTAQDIQKLMKKWHPSGFQDITFMSA